MTRHQRQDDIVDCVNRRGRMTVEALAAQFSVSAETVRRDLAALAAEGRLQKVHGGAVRARLSVEASLQDRLLQDAEAKRIIAEKLPAAIAPGDTLFVDTGSTTLACATVLAGRGAYTVITNSLDIARVFGQAAQGSRVFVLGGQFVAGNAETVGAMTVLQVADFQTDHALLTVAAADADAGAMDADFDEAQVARAMHRQARQTVLVAAASKIGRRAAHRVCAWSDVDVFVTDQPLAGSFARALDEAQVRVL